MTVELIGGDTLGGGLVLQGFVFGLEIGLQCGGGGFPLRTCGGQGSGALGTLLVKLGNAGGEGLASGLGGEGIEGLFPLGFSVLLALGLGLVQNASGGIEVFLLGVEVGQHRGLLRLPRLMQGDDLGTLGGEGLAPRLGLTIGAFKVDEVGGGNPSGKGVGVLLVKGRNLRLGVLPLLLDAGGGGLDLLPATIKVGAGLLQRGGVGGQFLAHDFPILVGIVTSHLLLPDGSFTGSEVVVGFFGLGDTGGEIPHGGGGALVDRVCLQLGKVLVGEVIGGVLKAGEFGFGGFCLGGGCCIEGHPVVGPGLGFGLLAGFGNKGVTRFLLLLGKGGLGLGQCLGGKATLGKLGVLRFGAESGKLAVDEAAAGLFGIGCLFGGEGIIGLHGDDRPIDGVFGKLAAFLLVFGGIGLGLGLRGLLGGKGGVVLLGANDAGGVGELRAVLLLKGGLGLDVLRAEGFLLLGDGEALLLALVFFGQSLLLLIGAVGLGGILLGLLSEAVGFGLLAFEVVVGGGVGEKGLGHGRE